MNKKVKIAAYTQKKPDPSKVKNGDAFAYQYLENENLLIAVVADGVGGRVCDWLASDTVARNIISAFTEFGPSTEIEERIEKAIISSHVNLLDITGDCAGLAAAASIVVTDFVHLWHCTVGDTRVYSLQKDTWEQLSTDQITFIPLKDEKGKLRLQKDGTPYIRKAITSALGGTLKDLIVQKTPLQYECVLLASDGFHEVLGHFETDLHTLIAASDMQERLERIFVGGKSFFSDDATAFVIRFEQTKLSDTTLRQLIQDAENYTDNKVSTAQIQIFVYAQLSEAIEKKDAAFAHKLLAYCRNFNLKYSQSEWFALIDQMKQHNFLDGEIYQQIRTLGAKSWV